MLLAVDATNWIHSTWHAQRGQGVLNSVRARLAAIVDRLSPSHAIACFDRRSFRHDLFPAYKAGRKEKPEGLQRDLCEAPDVLSGIATICQEDGFEADDCLSSLAAIGKQLNQKVVLASPDKDLRQCLVEGHVTILKSFTLCGANVTECHWYTAARLQKEFHLVPSQWTQMQALCGDSTDGIGGVAGWGEQTAAAALARWGTIARMLENSLSIKMNKTQQASLLKLRHGDQLAKLLQLVTLRSDVAAAWDAVR
jgi:DNA polymerase I